MQHYDIDTGSDYPRTQLITKFKKNVRFRRTEYMSIEIKVLDINKIQAANMANDIANLLDSVKTSIQSVRAIEALDIVKRRYEDKERQITLTVDSLKKLGAFGVQNYKEQAAVITEQYARAKMANNSSVANELKELESKLALYGPVHEKLSEELNKSVTQLVDLEAKYAEAKIDAEQHLSHKFVINKAVPAEKKAEPLRSLIIVVSMVSAFACSVLVFAIVNNYKYYRKRKELIESKEV
jgi:hypothetical protein